MSRAVSRQPTTSGLRKGGSPDWTAYAYGGCPTPDTDGDGTVWRRNGLRRMTRYGSAGRETWIEATQKMAGDFLSYRGTGRPCNPIALILTSRTEHPLYVHSHGAVGESTAVVPDHCDQLCTAAKTLPRPVGSIASERPVHTVQVLAVPPPAADTPTCYLRAGVTCGGQYVTVLGRAQHSPTDANPPADLSRRLLHGWWPAKGTTEPTGTDGYDTGLSCTSSKRPPVSLLSPNRRARYQVRRCTYLMVLHGYVPGADTANSVVRGIWNNDGNTTRRWFLGR